MTLPALARFMARVSVNSEGCWLWTGKAKTQFGYGVFSAEGRQRLARVWSYTTHHGDVPAGHKLINKCGVFDCVNPEHLRPASLSEIQSNRVRPEKVDVRTRISALSLVDPVTGCWNWRARCGDTGYGQIKYNGDSSLAHRVSYEAHIGPIPEGLQIDHLCRNRGCVNPEHMEPVTGKENKLRGNTVNAKNASKTHCRKGHPYDQANTMIHNSKRYCLACRNTGGSA